MYNLSTEHEQYSEFAEQLEEKVQDQLERYKKLKEALLDFAKLAPPDQLEWAHNEMDDITSTMEELQDLLEKIRSVRSKL